MRKETINWTSVGDGQTPRNLAQSILQLALAEILYVRLSFNEGKEEKAEDQELSKISSLFHRNSSKSVAETLSLIPQGKIESTSRQLLKPSIVAKSLRPARPSPITQVLDERKPLSSKRLNAQTRYGSRGSNRDTKARRSRLLNGRLDGLRGSRRGARGFLEVGSSGQLGTYRILPKMH